MTKPTLTVLLPAYNESKTMKLTIDDVRQYAPNARILVIDNNSTNGTGKLAKTMGADVITITKQGKGNAVRGVIQDINTPYCVMMDSDYTYPAKYIQKIIAELWNGADVVMGYRNDIAYGAMTRTNKFGNRCLSLMASILYWSFVHDVCTGLWGFKTKALKNMELISDGFMLEADLFSNAVCSRCNISQIPIYYRARIDGSLAKLKVLDGFKIGWFLIRRRLPVFFVFKPQTYAKDNLYKQKG